MLRNNEKNGGEGDRMQRDRRTRRREEEGGNHTLGEMVEVPTEKMRTLG